MGMGVMQTSKFKYVDELVKELTQDIPGFIVFTAQVGSFMVGTNDDKSDIDIKGIFVPYHNNLLLCNYKDTYSKTTGTKNSSNTSNDVDIEIYSIHKFIKMLKHGDIIAVELLFLMAGDPTNDIFYTVDMDVFDELIDNRKRFVRNSMFKFISYTKQQIKTYRNKTAKFAELMKLRAILDEYVETVKPEKNEKLNLFLEADGPFIMWNFVDVDYSQPNPGNRNLIVEVGGVKYDGRIKLSAFIEAIDSKIKDAGNRVRGAKNGIDSKSTYHSFRLLDEMRELMETGELKFPLKNRDKLIKLKQGNNQFENADDLYNELNRRIDELDAKLDLDKFPIITDKEIDAILLRILE